MKDILSKILKSSYSSISRERSGKLVETITNETKISKRKSLFSGKLVNL